MALYVLAASEGGRRRGRLFVLAVAPAAWINIFAGQNGFLTSALMIAGLAQLGRRPILRGSALAFSPSSRSSACCFR